MREILFRAKRIDNGEWVEGSLLVLDADSGYYFITEEYTSASTLPVRDIIFNHTHFVKSETICQYTGLCDKNGRKIWENDIVKTYNSKGEECHIERIVWADYSLNEGWCSGGIRSLIKYDKRVFNTGFGKSDARKCEVIGNVFDNPELLEKAR